MLKMSNAETQKHLLMGNVITVLLILFLKKQKIKIRIKKIGHPNSGAQKRKYTFLTYI